ncbi:MAG: hypothetical protein KF730_11635 [Sphingomonas sp.]|uniref:hypothetical protein n=1 Tax=Sphingomonas sp. TaxID=28214 RepID=UPI0025E9325A|nr:hypothetical protein [Sphingomonas sp.]MBX3565211.1 hypothetical protein [Sphingomonas sp.]
MGGTPHPQASAASRRLGPSGDANEGRFRYREVEDISLGVTIIVTDDNRRVIVANGTMAQRTVVKLPPT